MADFIWIIAAERQASLGRGGISPNYIIPQGLMNGREKLLIGNILWIILRGGEDRCIAMAVIKRVEKFSEGYYSGDFLVSCETTKSIRLCSSFEAARPYELSTFRSLEIGVHEITHAQANSLKALVSQTIQVKLAPPPDSALKVVKLNSLPRKGEGLLRGALSQIAQTFTLDQIWAAGTGTKLGPFGNFTSRLLFLHGFDPSTSTDFLRNNEPVFFSTELVPTGLRVQNTDVVRLERSVDLDFTEIDPNTVYAREFVLSDSLPFDLEKALIKTEAAEKLHQDMLRDISSYLKSQFILPYESSSVDLLASINGQIRIFEIKSTTSVNIVAQAAKGAFQVACYLNAMIFEYQLLDGFLILHKTDNPDLERFVHAVLDRLNVKHLTYDPKIEWPNRVEGLLH